MTGRGVSMRAAWEYASIIRAIDPVVGSKWRRDIVAHADNVNPSHEFWDVLLREKFPFLKRSIISVELLSHNRDDLWNVVSALAAGHA
jgi:hypothetical protein